MSGGHIEITVKNIKNKDDLYIKDEQFVQAFKKAEHGMIEIIVRDSGIGIKEEDHDKLFKLFGSLKSTKELNPGGIGLGLHISKMIVQSFGGHISFKSKYELGS